MQAGGFNLAHDGGAAAWLRQKGRLPFATPMPSDEPI
jgi:hypothetical protein